MLHNTAKMTEKYFFQTKWGTIRPKGLEVVPDVDW